MANPTLKEILLANFDKYLTALQADLDRTNAQKQMLEALLVRVTNAKAEVTDERADWLDIVENGNIKVK